MTNIFHKKDGLADAVKSVMEVNQFHREAEAQVNEKFGVVSRKALPHEQQASWDSEFNKIISEGAMKRMSMGDDGGMETYKKKPEGYSPKQMMIAKIAGNPEKIDAQDLAALRAGKKMDEEEQIDELKGYQGRRGQKLLHQVHNRAFKRLDKAIDKKDTKTVRKNSEIMSNAWDRMKDVYEEEQIDELNLSGVKPSANIEDRRTKGSRMDRPVSNQVTKSDQMKTPAMSKADRLDEKAVSKAQHRFFGLVRGIQKGKAKGSPEAEKAAKSMSVKSVRDYAKTKEKGLPEKIDEESLDSIQEEIATNLYAELNYVMEQHGEEAGDEWIANLSEEQLAIMEGFMDYLKSKFGTQSMRKDVEKKYGGEKPTLSGSLGGSAARKAEKDRLAMGAREAGTYGKQYAKPKPKSTVSSVDPKTANAQSAANRAKADASRPTADMARKALNNKPTAPAAKAPAPAPVKKAKPAAPAPVKRVSNIKGGETAASYAKRSAQFGKERGGGR